MIAPEVGNETLNVAKSPTAPATGVKLLIKTDPEKLGVSVEAEVPPAISTNVTTVPTRASSVSEAPPEA